MKLSLLFATVLAFTLSFGAAAPAFAKRLPQVTKDRFHEQIDLAQKPTIALVVPKDCSTCAAVEEAFAANAGQFDNMQVVKVDAGDTRTLARDTPGVIVFIPGGRGVVAETSNYGKDDAGTAAFLKAQSDYFAKRAVANAAFEKARDAYNAAEAPYGKRIGDLLEEGRRRYKADIDALYALEDKKYASRNAAEREVAEKAYGDALEAFAKKSKPEHDQVEAIQKESQAALSSLLATFNETAATVRKLDEDESQILK